MYLQIKNMLFLLLRPSALQKENISRCYLDFYLQRLLIVEYAKINNSFWSRLESKYV